jgi:CBS domain-containing protein
MKVAEILNRKGRQVFTIGVEQTALDAVRQLVERNVGSLVVLSGDGHKLGGIITERDILRECNRRFALLDKTRVGEVMSTDVLTGTSQDDIGQVLGLMTERRVRHLPIVDGGQVVGMVSIGDVGKQIQHACEVENADLKDLITGHYVSAAE